ncbi:phage virion morphogenesis protein [Nevskia sp.]|uniref:phage virion morphogenesis protein n=1 Tax=Nevskia sp. TaxID=1929292 RepID=UPI0025D6546C|nr:phage virion morphogenesis protein [Nevskia sp.]
MAGAIVDIDLRGLLTFDQAFARIERLLQHPEPLLEDIGEYLLLSVDERFDRREAPDGTPWAPVSEEYAERKAAGKATKRSGAVTDPGNILELTRDLRRLTRYQVDGELLLIGSDREYAATHQFGDPKRGIVARPVYGMSDEDNEEAARLVIEHLTDAVDDFG